VFSFSVSSTHGPPQASVRHRQLALARARRYAEQLCDLLVREALDVVQDEDAAATPGQSCDRAFEIDAKRDGGLDPIWRSVRVPVEQSESAPIPSRALAENVDRDGPKPGVKPGRCIDPIETLDRPDPHFLQDILGISPPSAEEAEQQLVQPRTVSAVQDPEGLLVPRPAHTTCQLAIVRYFAILDHHASSSI
jgi:hypothetical protein